MKGFRIMKITIDLWTKQLENHYECFNVALVDGFENTKIPFDEYKIICQLLKKIWLFFLDMIY